VQAAGAAAQQRRAAVHERFAAQIAATFLDADRPPPYVVRACVGAIHELVCDALMRSGPESLPGLLEPILDVQRRLARPR
jgi:hypothetical protein